MLAMRLRFLLVVTAALGLSMAASELPKAKLEPTPSLPEHAAALAQAIGAHDRGEFERAIDLYRQVLAENPDDVAAIYELGFSLQQSRAYSECVKTTRMGVRYQSKLLPHLRSMLATCLDLSGQAKRATRVYRETVADTPDDALLRFNYAVTLRSIDDRAEAMDQVKAALTLNPEHASSHLLLADLYTGAVEKVPGILARLRFLTLDPRSPRSAPVLQELHNQLSGNADEGKDGTINISLNLGVDDKGSEGDFAGAAMMISLKAAAQILEERKSGETSVFHRALGSIEGLVAVAAESNTDPPREAFAARYYVPYFAAAQEAGHLEALVNVVYSSSNLDEVAEWIDKNPDQVEAFQVWSERYGPWRGVVINN